MNQLQLRGKEGVLILRLGAVGDVARTLPCLARLRDSWPDLRLGWVVEHPSAALLPFAPWLERVFIFPRDKLEPRRMAIHPGQGTKALRRFVRELRGFRADMTLDFQGSLKSALIGLLSGARTRVGFTANGSREGSHLFSHIRICPSSPRLNRVEKNLELIAPLISAETEVKFPFTTARSTNVSRDFLTRYKDRIRVAVHSGTSRLQAHKRWPAENFVRLLNLFASEEEVVPILTWGPGEREAVEWIRSRSQGSAVTAPPTNLREMRELLAGCHVFVGGDTGPMHLAWTQNIPVVALFGATDPLINGPLGPGHRILAPAWDGSRPFPRRGDASAMNLIHPEEVHRAVLELLPGRSPMEKVYPSS